MRAISLIIFFICVLLCRQVNAQLNVYPNGNAQVLANTIVGSGIQISGATLSCGNGNAGTFAATSTNLGLSGGILLSTGSVYNAVGPNNDEGNANSNGQNCPYSSDPQLTAIVSNANYDACILQFDIVPACSTLNINYVFGSEEYPEFVGTAFNDVFGFFISGPNPSGGNYNNYNIARLPNGTAVAINTINAGSNSQYFVNNGDGSGSGGPFIQYDGFTQPLTAAASVVPCSTYHMKLAIADAGDCDYNSGVFLAYQGLTCPASQVPVVAANTTPVMCGNDGTATVNVSNYSGTPTYSWTPGGGTTQTITQLSPGTYTCVVGFSIPCPYSVTVTATVTGSNVINSNMSSTPSTCGAPNGTATANVSGGSGPYTYSWSTSPPQTTATASGLTPGTYTVTISDAGSCTITRTVTVNNQQPALNVNDSINNTTCGQSNGSIFISNVSGGASPYSYSWSGGQSTDDISGITAGSYTLTITDNLNCVWTYTYDVPDVVTLPVNTAFQNERCKQGNGTASINVLQGVPPYTYVWSTVPAQTTPAASGLSEGTYTVTVSDAAGCSASAVFNLSNVNDVFNGTVDVTPPEPTAGTSFTVSLNAPSIWLIDQSNWPDNTVSDSSANAFNFPEYGSYNGSFWVTSENGCKDTIDYTVFVKDYMTLYVPNAFTPNGDLWNDTFRAQGTLIKTFQMLIYDRWGNLLYETEVLDRGWDGTYKGQKVMGDVYVWKIYVTDFYDIEHTLIGRVTVVR